MHDLTGRISNVSFSYEGKPLLTLELNERNSALEMVDELKSLDILNIKIDRFKKKRSLDANAYCWTLISKIAEKTGLPKTEVYMEFIREMGGNFDVVCIKTEAAPTLRKAWESNGIGWQTEIQGSKLKGCTNVFLYYGSSCFDVQQMSRLIDLVVQDCFALGIETKSQAEIASLLGAWDK